MNTRCKRHVSLAWRPHVKPTKPIWLSWTDYGRKKEASLLKSTISATTKYNIHSLFTFMLFIKKKTTYYIITIVVCGIIILLYSSSLLLIIINMMWWWWWLLIDISPQHVSLVISDADTISTYSRARLSNNWFLRSGILAQPALLTSN